MRQKNNIAAEMLPIRLIISLAIIATIVVLVVGASGTLGIYLAEQQIEQQCLHLRSELSTMVGTGAFRDLDDPSAPDGTKRVCTLFLPDSLVYLAFGYDSSIVQTSDFTPTLVEDEAVIVYKVEGGSKKVIWLADVAYPFREGNFVHGRWMLNEDSHGYVIRRGGTSTLVFECVQKNHDSCILLY